MTTQKRTTIYLPPELMTAVKLHAVQEDTSVSEILKRAAEAYVFDKTHNAQPVGDEEFAKVFAEVRNRNDRLGRRLADA